MTKKNVYQVLSVLFLLIFSFYYTNKSIDIIRQTDPIMKQIKNSSTKYETKAVNAKISEDTIIPGLSGTDVDYEQSYQKMKKYGSYNESLTVFKETKPTISIDDTYDKYVISGNNYKKSVALVFKIEKNSNITNINNILLQEDIKSTMFMDGLWLENNLEVVKNLNNSELEILNYNGTYQEIYFSSSINYLNNITGKQAKYCYADYDNKEVIELCSKLKLHTILPTIKVGNYPYKDIKNKLENASIISLPVNTSTEIELKTVISHIKSKGYTFKTLEELLSESLEK